MVRPSDVAFTLRRDVPSVRRTRSFPHSLVRFLDLYQRAAALWARHHASADARAVAFARVPAFLRALTLDLPNFHVDDISAKLFR